MVGVMPKSFLGYEGNIDLWMPVTTAIVLLENRQLPVYQARDARWLELVAQLKPGVTIDAAQAELDLICRRLQDQYPSTNADRSAHVFPLEEYMLGRYNRTLLLLWGAVGFVLLIVCANVANLLLTRTIGRSREFAIRAALGAGAARLIWLLVAETVVLALCGGALGVFLGAWGLEVARATSPADLPGYVTNEIDLTVVAFTLALSLVTGMALAVAPVVRILGSDLIVALKDNAAATRSGRSRRWSVRNALVVLEVAAALAMHRVIASFLFQTSATDPATFGTVVLVLASVAGGACFLAGRRATKIDPIVALKYE